MADILPYQAVQKEERKAKILKITGICHMIIGFGIFACMAWSGNDSPIVTTAAMLGLLAGIIGIKISFNARNLKRNSDLMFDVLAAASIRYKKLEEDSSSNVYRDTISESIKKLTDR
jgi:hypothetical protein